MIKKLPRPHEKILYVILKGRHSVPPFRIIFKHFSFCKLSHWMCHTQNSYAWFYGQLIFWAASFYSVSSNENIWKDFLVCLFNLSPALGMIYVNKNVHLVMQHPSLGSMTERPIDKPEILIPTPKLGERPSIYICLSPVKMVDFMHPKWKGCIIINSLIFFIVSRNILYCLNLGKNYLWTKPASNKNDRLYQKTPYKQIHWPNGLWKDSPYFIVYWKRI